MSWNKSVYLCFFLGIILSALVTYVLIPILKRLKFGQTIREDGPKWHEKKSGTPTMGGIGFLAVTVILTLVFAKEPSVRFCIIFAALFGVIGFLDDGIKIFFKRNLGLNSRQKLILQTLVSVVFLVLGLKLNYFSTSITVPFTELSFDLGIFYVVLMTVYMVGFTNAVNLTDGLDGLAAGVTCVVALFFVYASTVMNSQLIYLATSFCGALIGFLIFNFYPAKVFMGDTGSLFLGGVCGACAILLKIEILLILVGIIYVVEALSVIIQVAYFKRTRKRVFLMTPIHHHFEMLKMKEINIVYMFTAVTVIACLIAGFAVS